MRVLSVLRGTLLLGALAYATVGAGLWFVQDRMVFPGAFGGLHDPAEVAKTAAASRLVRVDIARRDGPTVTVWTRDGHHGRLLLWFHGNGETAAVSGAMADAVEAMGWDFVAVEYRGYADVPGAPSEAGLVADARAAWDWAVSTGGWAPERVVIQGGSLGGGVAVALASQVDAGGLVLSSTFDSLKGVAAERFTMFPVASLLRTTFDSVALASKVSEPALQLHSRDDRTVPFTHGERLRDALPHVTFVPLDGWGHAGSYLRQDAIAAAAWKEFLDRVVP